MLTTTNRRPSPPAGEYGELLVGAEGGRVLEGEAPVSASEADVVGLLEAVVQVRAGRGQSSGACAGMAHLTCTGSSFLRLDISATCSRLTVCSSPTLQRPGASAACREYGLTALAKLEPRFRGQAPRIKATIGAYAHSAQLEVQTRSVEYSRLLSFPAIGPQVGRGAVPWLAGGHAACCRAGKLWWGRAADSHAVRVQAG